MVKIKSLECPNCGGQVDQPDGKEYFHCIYCGNKIVIEDGTKKKIEIRKEVKHYGEITAKNVSDLVVCGVCGGTIPIYYQIASKCRECGKYYCSNCQSETFKSCCSGCHYKIYTRINRQLVIEDALKLIFKIGCILIGIIIIISSC